MIYYTQILFVKPGKETLFHAFEDQVLPQLQRCRGELVYRVRPPKPSVLVTTLDYPYEPQIVTFPTKAIFGPTATIRSVRSTYP